MTESHGILIVTFGFQDVGRDFPNTCTVLAAVNQRLFQPRSQGSLLLKGAPLEVKRVLLGTGLRWGGALRDDNGSVAD